MTLNINLHKLKSKNNQRHNTLLPDEQIRLILTGPSRSGKTQRLVNMLLEPGFLDYNHLVLYTPTINQFCYHILSEGFNNGLSKQDIIGIINRIDEFKEDPDDDISNESLDEIIQSVAEERENSRLADRFSPSENITVDCYTPDIATELPRAEEQDSAMKHIVVFDDCMNREEMKPVIVDYFCNGRHNNISSFYLNQKYTNRDTVIRENANMICLFSPSQKPLQTIYTDCCQSDVDWEPFSEACKRTFKTPYNFVVIDKTADDIDHKFREGFAHALLSGKSLSKQLPDKVVLPVEQAKPKVKKLTKKMSNLRL